MTQAPRSGSGRNNPKRDEGGPREGAPRGGSARGGAPRAGSGSARGRSARDAFGRGSAAGAGRDGDSRPGSSRDGASRGGGSDRAGSDRAGSDRFGAERAGERRGPAREGAKRQGPARGSAARGKPARDGAPRGERPTSGGYRGSAEGSSEGRPFANRTPKPAGAKKTGNRQKPAGPKAFGRERFGKSLGPVRRPKAEGPKALPVDRLDVHNPDGVRLQKIMASAGVASRRVCEEMIEDGRVEVDGTIVTDLGVRVDPAKVAIHVDGIRLQLNDHLVYYVFNKPKGVICTMEDPEGRPCISDYLKNKNENERLFHVGRLDVNTEGLLLLTNDGELTNRLTHPSYEVPKTYLVQVRGPMAHGIGAQMREGIELEDGMASVDSFRLVDSTPGHILVEVVLHSGRNRVVRRLFEAVGHPVERLVRTQVGPIRVNDQRQGSIRVLGNQEVGHLLAAVGL
ncbi:pseudouridine synthase [Arthrobacter sp. AET 35A]|uniref:pseudouridine synthase n=1 Tax=Arthrobacter sp. AET 35A TaxID=2292643 RepID=UPI00177F365A|nr:pseudouridine synthase [Arthrobacter sp. AET 35A]MBE0011045.1 pseudouridine synthase [Arthrobacter sp. AET 35A]